MLRLELSASENFGRRRGNLVKKVSDGEVSGVFLCHGTPVPSDSLQDVYTNRPFARVFRALQGVEGFLAPMFAEVAEPFPEEHKKGGGNLSIGQIERIRQMHLEGRSVPEIAAAVQTTEADRLSATQGMMWLPVLSIQMTTWNSRDQLRKCDFDPGHRLAA